MSVLVPLPLPVFLYPLPGVTRAKRLGSLCRGIIRTVVAEVRVKQLLNSLPITLSQAKFNAWMNRCDRPERQRNDLRAG